MARAVPCAEERRLRLVAEAANAALAAAGERLLGALTLRVIANVRQGRNELYLAIEDFRAALSDQEGAK